MMLDILHKVRFNAINNDEMGILRINRKIRTMLMFNN